MKNINITILVENTVSENNLQYEHGISYWIQFDNYRILFDSGQGYALKNNAKRLNIDLSETNSIIISHGHYDHTGGLSEVINTCDNVKLFAHSQAFSPKFACRYGFSRYIGISEENRQAIFSNKVEYIDTTKPTEVFNGIFVTGEIPRKTDFEDTGGQFFLDKRCKKVDNLLDDQAVFFETENGIVILLGCAHAGVINTILYIHNLTNKKPIYAVLGGMHLLNADQHRLDKTADELRKFKIKILAPAHCTGDVAKRFLYENFKENYLSCSAGEKFRFKSIE